MDPVSSIGAMLASLNAAKNVAQAMIDTRDTAVFQSKMIEFQSKILDAQSSAFAANDERAALIESVRKLEARVAQIEAWGAEKQRYQLCKVGPGAVAYLPKRSEARGEPGHALCAQCYENGEKGYLQSNGEPRYDDVVFACSSCKGKIKPGRHELPDFAEDASANPQS